MSKHHLETYTCPNCDHVQEFQFWDSVNIQLDPEMQEKILSREFYSQKCDECGEVTQVLYSFLYHDMDRRLMVYVIVEQDPQKLSDTIEELNSFFNKAPDEQTNEVSELFSSIDDGYTKRVVTGYNDLLEKIYIARNGLDDRVIEAFKVIIAARQSEALKSKNLVGLYFDDVIGDEKQFVFVFEGGEIASLPFHPESYESMKNGMLTKMEAKTPKGYSLIDYNWAVDLLLDNAEGE